MQDSVLRLDLYPNWLSEVYKNSTHFTMITDSQFRCNSSYHYWSIIVTI